MDHPIQDILKSMHKKKKRIITKTNQNKEKIINNKEKKIRNINTKIYQKNP